MQITTIKLQEKTKLALDTLKLDNETYDSAVERLISQIRTKDLRKVLAEGYKNQSKAHLALLDEWESASKETDEAW